MTETTPPLVLLACSDEWLSRSFATVFEQRGYAVARVRSSERTIRLARRANPDVVVLEEGNGEIEALRVCSALGNDPLFDQTVPIVITSVKPVTPETRHAAYAAGAWEYCSHPVDLEALMLKLATFGRARAEGRAKRGERFVDRETGLYTEVALTRLAEQIGARARRRHEPLACVAIAMQSDARDRAAMIPLHDERIETFSDVAALCRRQARKSDIVAHMSDSRLVILAPDTDAEGAKLLVQRLRSALGRSSDSGTVAADFELRAGYSAVADLGDSQIEPTELVKQAAIALDRLELGDAVGGALGFDELPRGTAD
jgi:GGDEF domain-containing protein